MYGLFVERHAIAVSEFCKVNVLYIHPVSPNLNPAKKVEFDFNVEHNLNVLRIYYKASYSLYLLGINFSLINQFKYLKYSYLGYKFLRF